MAKKAYSFRCIRYDTVEHICSQTVWAESEEEARAKLDDLEWESWHESSCGSELSDDPPELESIDDWPDPEDEEDKCTEDDKAPCDRCEEMMDKCQCDCLGCGEEFIRCSCPLARPL